MKKLVFYSYSKCSTCRKALKWLDQKNLEYKLIDIVKEPPLVEYLELALAQFSEDNKSLFNTRGKSFQEIKIDIYKLSNEEIIKLLLSDGKLIKRPFLVHGGKIILGFNETEYSNHFI